MSIQPTNQAPGNTVTILYAEDNPVVRRVTLKVMNKNGYHVICAEDGREALEKFEEHSDDIDVVFLDILMPHHNGTEVADEILKQKPDLPVILSSGYYSDDQLKGDVMGRIKQFLQKPYDQNQLVESIRNALPS